MNCFEKDIIENISKNLRKLREINEFSQDMIGNLLGVDRSTCSNWERGKTTPKNAQLFKLSRLYNVSIDIIMSNHDNDLGMVATPPLQRVFGESFLSELSDEERLLLLKFRMLTDGDKKEVDEYMDKLRNSDYYTKEIENDITEE